MLCMGGRGGRGSARVDMWPCADDRTAGGEVRLLSAEARQETSAMLGARRVEGSQPNVAQSHTAGSQALFFEPCKANWA